MVIKEFTIENYQCFLKPATIKFESGFNVIVGKNNVGKSSLVRLLSLKFENVAHKSKVNIKEPGDPGSQYSIVRLRYEVTKEEFRKILLIHGREFCFPPAVADNDHTYTHTAKLIFDKPTWLLECQRGTNGTNLTAETTALNIYNKMPVANNAALHITCPNAGEVGTVGNVDNTHSKIPSYETFFPSKLLESIHVLDAVRAHTISQDQTTRGYLEPDAANLPHEIRNLQRTYNDRERYNDAVHTVFPDLGLVTFAETSGNIPHIMVHQFGLSDTREDLAIPHTECGTGIGQVLAILHTVVTSKSPRIIVIDEPNSFLHPGAVRSLIEVLKSYPHQYILTTHSPAVIATCEPSTITLIEQTDGVSDFVQIDPSKEADLHDLLSEIGVSFSDMFGSDNVLWVEGKTEEIAYKKILRKLRPTSLARLSILAVKDTNVLIGKHKNAFVNIYQRLSARVSLLPQKIHVLLDRETKTDQQIAEWEKSQQSIKFIPRRMYENYLLHPRAIADQISVAIGENDVMVTENLVSEWIEEHRKEAKYIASDKADDQNWQKYIHGGYLLKQLFQDLSEKRCEFDKVRDSIGLTVWLLENEPSALQEIIDLLDQILESDGKLDARQHESAFATQ